jgi:hypothetical protein
MWPDTRFHVHLAVTVTYRQMRLRGLVPWESPICHQVAVVHSSVVVSHSLALAMHIYLRVDNPVVVGLEKVFGQLVVVGPFRTGRVHRLVSLYKQCQFGAARTRSEENGEISAILCNTAMDALSMPYSPNLL